MRSLLLASGLFLAVLSPVPAFADEPADGAGQIAEKLNDPLTQYAVAGMLSAMSKSVLEMRVEPLVKAMDGLGDGFGGKRMHRLPPDATLADLAGTDHAAVRDGIVERVPKAMSAMGGMAAAAQKMMPELERMAREMRQSVPQL
jgi:hypothetical protein